ncbi:MAG: hypothetical protein MUQ62_11575, partial [Reinekea forsetii]|nr:hypothetical protein [Reinekea forsetii]
INASIRLRKSPIILIGRMRSGQKQNWADTFSERVSRDKKSGSGRSAKNSLELRVKIKPDENVN